MRWRGCPCPGAPLWSARKGVHGGDSADQRWAPGRSSRARSPAPGPPVPWVALPARAHHTVPSPTMAGWASAPSFMVAMLRVTSRVAPTPLPCVQAGPGGEQQGLVPLLSLLEQGWAGGQLVESGRGQQGAPLVSPLSEAGQGAACGEWQGQQGACPSLSPLSRAGQGAACGEWRGQPGGLSTVALPLKRGRGS